MEQHHPIMGKFGDPGGQTYRQKDTLDDQTFRTSVEYVAHTFRDNDKGDPRYNKYGSLALLLHRQ